MSANHQLDQRLSFMRFDHRSRTALQAAKPVLDEAIPSALDGFYEQLRGFAETRDLFKGGRGESAQARQVSHWRRMLSGDQGADYLQAVERIGQSNARAGLEPRWSIGGYALVLDKLIHAVLGKRSKGGLFGGGKADEGAADQVAALSKAVFLDMDLALSAYFSVLLDERDRLEADRQANERQQAAAVAALGAALSKLAAGDLSARVEGVLSPEFESLKIDFDHAASALDKAMGAVSRGASSIRSGTDDMARAADDMAQRTEQQASTLQQTAAAVEQLTATVDRTAKSAKQVSARVARPPPTPKPRATWSPAPPRP
jgi:methyl-accepting chemotaxis protein